jgi:hypothetical protein
MGPLELQAAGQITKGRIVIVGSTDVKAREKRICARRVEESGRILV